jgi:Stage II sporulation protein E (SpoIIE)
VNETGPPPEVVAQLLDLAPNCLMVVGGDGDVRWANASARSLLRGRGESLDPDLWAQVRDRAVPHDGPPVDLGVVHATDRSGVARLWQAVVASGEGRRCLALQMVQPGREDIQRLVAFADLAATLARVRTYQAALGAVAAQLAATLGVDFASVAVLDADRRVLTMEHTVDLDPDIAEEWRETFLEVATPLTEAATTGRAVHVADRCDLGRRYPAIAGDVVRGGFAAMGAAPITGFDGRLEGVIGYASRLAGPAPDPSLLTAVSELVGRALARARQARHDAELAGSFQRLMLPAAIDDPVGWTIGVAYVPSGSEGRAGGDWYDAFSIPGGRQMIVVGDVVGHGPAASAAMGVLRTATRTLALSGVDEPAELLVRLDAMVGQLGLDRFATMSAAAIDTATGLGRLALAGHPPPTIRRASGDIERPAPAPGAPIGSGLPGRPATACFELEPGDVLLFYSDGLLEESGDLEEGFGRLDRALHAGAPRLDDLIGDLTATPPRDDVVVVEVARAADRARLAVR